MDALFFIKCHYFDRYILEILRRVSACATSGLEIRGNLKPVRDLLLPLIDTGNGAVNGDGKGTGNAAAAAAGRDQHERLA